MLDASCVIARLARVRVPTSPTTAAPRIRIRTPHTPHTDTVESAEDSPRGFVIPACCGSQSGSTHAYHAPCTCAPCTAQHLSLSLLRYAALRYTGMGWEGRNATREERRSRRAVTRSCSACPGLAALLSGADLRRLHADVPRKQRARSGGLQEGVADGQNSSCPRTGAGALRCSGGGVVVVVVAHSRRGAPNPWRAQSLPETRLNRY